MAITKLSMSGYGQIEPNHVIFTVTGNNESQCKLDADLRYIENGMLVAVDKAIGEIFLPVADETLPIGLHYSTEKIYNQFTSGLKNFKLERNTQLPRVGFLSQGEVFTTNALCADIAASGAEYVSEAKVKEAVAAAGTAALYGTYSTLGYIKLTATKPTSGPVLKVVKATTMPDGQYAVKFQVL